MDVTVKRRDERRAGPQPRCSSSPTSSAPFFDFKDILFAVSFVNLPERFSSQCSETEEEVFDSTKKENFLWTRTLENSLL